MSRQVRAIASHYGLALVSFAVVVAVALSLRYFQFQINLTFLVVIGIVVTSWWGGRGPGIFFCALITVATFFFNGAPPNEPFAVFIFGQITVAAILVLIAYLISGSKLSERRLRVQTDMLLTTLSSIGDAVITTDREGLVNFINPTAEQLTGCSAADAIGRPLDEIYKIEYEDTGRRLEGIFVSIKEKREVISFVDRIALIDCNDDRIPIADTASPILDAGGAFGGAVIVFQDVSERLKAEAALHESEARAQQSQKLEAIGTLTGGIAHDFNNLLTAILGFVDLSLVRLAKSDPVYPNLLRVSQAATRGAELTQKLLAFSRRQHLDRQVIDLNRSTAEILRLLERVLGENITVSFIPSQDLWPVSADAAQMEQVIMNLSINARDAMPGGGRLSIETKNIVLDEHYCRQYPYFSPGKFVQILVSDTGTGMNPDVLDKIFEPFFTTKDAQKGTGLGLSMVYGTVKQHEGQINVYSEPGHGTTFKIFLPAVEVTLEVEKPSPAPPAAGGDETILIAEDEESLRVLAQEVLTALGYNVLVASNGQEAAEVFENSQIKIDLLLFDYVMPVMGGAEAFLKIRELGGGATPLIFMTGYSSEILDNPNADGGHFDLGGARVIQKPYTLDGLGRAVREALDATK